MAETPAETSSRLPEPFRPSEAHIVDGFNVSELVSEAAGAHSPYGDLQFPMPVEQLLYTHPRPEDRPNLANGH